MVVLFVSLMYLFLIGTKKGASEGTYAYDVCQWVYLVCTNRNVGPWHGHKGALGTLRQSEGMYINALSLDDICLNRESTKYFPWPW